MKYIALSSTLFLALVCAAMSVHSSNELARSPTQFADYLQDNFDDYLEETKRWVREHRIYRSANTELEVELNSPFELKPDNPNGKAILLVHGLSDSPYSFSDVAKRLSDQGYLVRALLLPGHGAKPADLMLPEIEDWLVMVSHHTDMLAKEADEVWLGGFSTGANLAMIEAIDNQEVSGALLFSPAIISRKPLDFLAPWAKYLMDWADVDPEVSITRFDSLTMNGAALYYESSKMLRDRLESVGFDRPVMFTLSESDSVVDSEAVYTYFNEHFTHAENKLVWYGEREWEDAKVNAFSMKLPEKRISTGSHMSALYSPSNPFYGKNGSFKVCNNGQSESQEKACEEGAETWYSSFDYSEKDKTHSRLTWNPYFEETMRIVLYLLGDATKP